MFVKIVRSQYLENRQKSRRSPRTNAIPFSIHPRFISLLHRFQARTCRIDRNNLAYLSTFYQ